MIEFLCIIDMFLVKFFFCVVIFRVHHKNHEMAEFFRMKFGLVSVEKPGFISNDKPFQKWNTGLLLTIGFTLCRFIYDSINI